MTGQNVGQSSDQKTGQKVDHWTSLKSSLKTTQKPGQKTGQNVKLKLGQHTDRDALLTNDDDQHSQRDVAISVDQAMTEEEMVENIKTHRQMLANTKTQKWPMHQKLKTLRKLKRFLKKHEGDMKQSSQAKDILSIYRSYVEKAFRRLKREIDNLIVILTPWELRIKKIESQFGSVVASYFTFLRWIFWINTVGFHILILTITKSIDP